MDDTSESSLANHFQEIPLLKRAFLRLEFEQARSAMSGLFAFYAVIGVGRYWLYKGMNQKLKLGKW